MLSQVQNGEERVISYGSRTLSVQEKNYCITRKKLLAIIHHIKLFKDYLLGKHFKVRTDLFSLKYLHRFKEPEGQLAQWIDFLQAFDFETITHPRAKHSNADALSRKNLNCSGKKCHCCKSAELQNEPPQVIETKLWKPTEFENEEVLDPDIGPVYKFLEENPVTPYMVRNFYT